MDHGQGGRDRGMERLKRQWLQQAEAAFERMFGEGRREQWNTFSQREEVACAAGRELAAWLLERHTQADAGVRPAAEEPPRCPKCKQTGERVTKPKEPLPERRLASAAGEIRFRREQWGCRRCRIVFFSVRPAAAVGDGGLQSAAGAKGGTSGGAGLIPGSQ